MKKIKINEDQLREKIAEVIRDAAGFQRQGGEIQLYGRINDGAVYDFFTETFAGHNSWIQGDNIIHLYTCEWFDPLKNEYIPDWLEGELVGRDELVAEFVEHLKSEELNWEKPHKEWDEFSRKYPELWDESLPKWRETWLEFNIPEMVDAAIERIEDLYRNEIELVNE